MLTGRLLLRQAPRTFLAQALVSPDGSVITAMVLRGKIIGNPEVSGGYPADLSVAQVSVETGHPLGVIYRRYLGDTWNRLQSVPQEPILIGAQLFDTVLSGCIDQSVLIDPPH